MKILSIAILSTFAVVVTASCKNDGINGYICDPNQDEPWVWRCTTDAGPAGNDCSLKSEKDKIYCVCTSLQ
ncbi:hypothetical protein PtrM4_024580 [Pyrenophora tritici-repentis]|uniref:Uncharacterized protein n=1 Tax=Pyrenophora tritici-repentis TaxID=45151 RepID=A0A834S8Z3_9PLEO|nr:hypothetical protein PtrM4_024580 [Pyrenophora tritici-repentis]